MLMLMLMRDRNGRTKKNSFRLSTEKLTLRVRYINYGIGWIWGYSGNYRDYRGYIGIIGYILGLCWDSGKENGNYYLGFRV